eukprot:995736-Amorphochlora_amoeboformis.AAC.1
MGPAIDLRYRRTRRNLNPIARARTIAQEQIDCTAGRLESNPVFWHGFLLPLGLFLSHLLALFLSGLS